jgi:hypothetical protein
MSESTSASQSQPDSDLVKLAQSLIYSKHYTFSLAALIVSTGRTPGELIKSGDFSPHDQDSFSLWFDLKLSQGRQLLPTLLPAPTVLKAISRLRSHPDVQSLLYLSPNDILRHCQPHLIRVAKEHFHLPDLDALYQAYAASTGASVSPSAATPPKPSHTIFSIWSSDKPRLQAISDRFDTHRQSDTTAITLDLAESALKLAQLLDTSPEYLESTVTALLEQVQQLQSASAPSPQLPPTPDSDTPSTNSDLTVLREAVASLSQRLARLEASLVSSSPSPPTPTNTTTATQTASAHFQAPEPSTKRLPASTKIDRAVAAVIAYNDQCSDHDSKWTINESAIARLTGCNRPAIRRYFQQHQPSIDQHNLSHHLSPRHNIGKGKRGIKIEAVIH